MSLYRKPATVVKQQPSPRAALSRLEPIPFMNAKGWVHVTEFGIVDDYFDNLDCLALRTISYNPHTNQTIYETRDTTVTAIHYIQ